ncbi:hypothetical protein BDF19DRAFT_307272 [Syncephalis fuscata]|nr:hypothetical protein BDF19DRAFT_307272 [Syncephalis fuscata]
MFSFEGDYKRRKNIRLGGSQRVDNRLTLIQQAQQQRQQREEERRRQTAATQIQKFWKARRQRFTLNAQTRAEWDAGLYDYSQSWDNISLSLRQSSSIELCQQQDKLTEQLLIFYQQRYDLQRLVDYCEALLKPIESNGGLAATDPQSNDAGVFHSGVLRLYAPLLYPETHNMWRFRCQRLGKLVIHQLSSKFSDTSSNTIFLQLLKHLLNINNLPALANAHISAQDG